MKYNNDLSFIILTIFIFKICIFIDNYGTIMIR